MTRKIYVFSALAILIASFSASRAEACPLLNFCVDVTADSDRPPVGANCAETCDGTCTLRDAIEVANTTGCDVELHLQAGTYSLGGTTADRGEDGNAKGDIDITDTNPGGVKIIGVGAASTIIDGSAVDRVFHADPAASGLVIVEISGVTIRNGNPGASYGGGIFTAGPLTVIDSAVSGNTSGLNGGGIDVLAPGSLTLRGSTISDNESTTSNGGGLAMTGAGGTFILVDSTVSGNRAAGAGGGLSVSQLTELFNVTITNNTADNDGSDGVNDLGGGIRMTGGNMVFQNSILAGNTEGGVVMNPDCSNDGGGTYDVSSGYNLVGKQDGCSFNFTHTGDEQGTIASPLNPQLGSLGLHGGTTSTHLLLAGSPAIDAGNPAGCKDDVGAALTADQRGLARTLDGDGDATTLCDKGAVEVGCGNAVAETSEECDDGNISNTDACLNSCISATCGDGLVEAGVEECDDGNTDDTDACQNDCTLPPEGTTGGTTTGGTTTGGTTTGGTGTVEPASGGCSLIR